jgi:hypothetical protein
VREVTALVKEITQVSVLKSTSFIVNTEVSGMDRIFFIILTLNLHH